MARKTPKRNIPIGDFPQMPLDPYYGQSFPSQKADSIINQGSQRPQTQDIMNFLEFYNKYGKDGIGAGSVPQLPTPSPKPNSDFPITGQSDFSAHTKADASSSWEHMLDMNSSDSFLSYLSSLGITGAGEVGKDAAKDMNKQLWDAMINYALTQNERSYNEQLLKDQRIYDSPTNMLARLMGAGVSRDAAIAMLSGSSGSASALGASGSIAAPTGLAPSESAKNAMETKLMPINTALNVVSTISGLVSMGFSIPQAIQQTNALKYANAMSKEQLGGYTAAQKAFSVLHSIDAAADAFGSVTGAIDAINAAAPSNQGAAQFIANGGIDELKKYPTFASDYLRKTYHSERDAQDYSRQMDEYFAQQEARTEIEQTNAAKSHIEYEQCVMQLLQMDADLNRTYQAIRNGEIEIEINGVRLKRAQNDLSIDNIRTDAYLEAMNGNVDGSVSGKQMLSESIWRELFSHWRDLSIQQSPENYDKYEKFLRDNWDAACAVATIKAATSSQLADAWNAQDNNSASIWTRFTNIFFGTKTDQMVNLVGDAAKLGASVYLGTHNKNFVE